MRAPSFNLSPSQSLLPPGVVLQFLIGATAQIRGLNCHVSSSLRCWKLWQRIAHALLVQSLLDLKGAAGIRVRGDGKANDRYTGGFRRWPYGEGDGGRASSGSIQNSNKYAVFRSAALLDGKKHVTATTNGIRFVTGRPKSCQSGAHEEHPCGACPACPACHQGKRNA